jgi:hypothetical protein
MSADRDFVLDANTFIQPHRRFYPSDVCPGYWEALKWHNKDRRICSIDRVRNELEAGGDDLWDWAKRLPKGFFEATDDLEVVHWYRQLAQWVRAEPQFSPRAETDFASGADGWLVAFAKARSRVVVTLEEFDPVVRKRVPIPNLCKAFDVEYVNISEMLRELCVEFMWRPPTKK